MTGLTTSSLEVQRVFSSLMARHLYQPVHLPVVEPSEIYTRGTGEDFRNLIYHFQDPAGFEACLRPEWTLSIARHFRDELQHVPGVHRLFYHGPVYRREESASGRLREMAQMGIEHLGERAELDADAEVIGLVTALISALGLPGRNLRVGHLGLLERFLTSVAPEVFLADKFPRDLLLPEVLESSLLPAASPGTPVEPDATDGKSAALRRLNEGIRAAGNVHGREILSAVIELLHGRPRGVRTAQDIAENILWRMEGDRCRMLSPGQKAAILAFLALSGEPAAVLNEVRSLCTCVDVDIDASIHPLAEWFERLGREGVPSGLLVFEPGLRRRIRYYSGLIFEYSPYSAGDGSGRVLSGGRYDRLLQVLGTGRPTPAIGFGFSIERLAFACLRATDGDTGDAGN